MKKYTVIYERGKRNWSAYLPDLPGCVATGKTRAIVEKRIKIAVAMHVESLRFHGEPVPTPTTEAGTLRLSA
jgi:predicted RNase H-like HicB family nuclease